MPVPSTNDLRSRFLGISITTRYSTYTTPPHFFGAAMGGKAIYRQCKSCGKDVRRSAKECPYCGQPVQSGWFLKAAVAVGTLVLLGTLAIPINKDPVKERRGVLAEPTDPLEATDLAKIFGPGSTSTTAQMERAVKEITGKIVQWQLPVFVVTRMPDHFSIVTQAGTDIPGALLTVYPSDHYDMKFLESLKAGTTITIKGKISGTLKGRIKINPAFLI